MENHEVKKADYDYMIGDAVVEFTTKDDTNEKSRFDAYKTVFKENE